MVVVTDTPQVRRQLVRDGVGIALSVAAFGVVYGLAAREAGFSPVEALGMSVIAFAGAAQFTAVGLVAQGTPWLAIVVVTALLNARHALYAASLAPWVAGWRRRTRAVAAHGLTDESFALAMPAFRALGRADLPSYGLAVALTMPVWIGATALGALGGGLLPDPRSVGLDIVFPAAMAGLAVALIDDRRAAVAAISGVGVGLAGAVLVRPDIGVLLGGLVGPLLAMTWPAAAPAAADPNGTA